MLSSLLMSYRSKSGSKDIINALKTSFVHILFQNKNTKFYFFEWTSVPFTISIKREVKERLRVCLYNGKSLYPLGYTNFNCIISLLLLFKYNSNTIESIFENLFDILEKECSDLIKLSTLRQIDWYSFLFDYIYSL